MQSIWQRIWTSAILICLAVLFLAACNLPSGSPAVPLAPATLPPAATAVPTAVLPPAETPVPAASPTAAVTLSPDDFFQSMVKGGRVAYVAPFGEAPSDGYEGATVCVMDAGWSGRLCAPPAVPMSLAWSPAGDRLLINEGNVSLKIWTLGAGVRLLLENGTGPIFLDPDWSPDGKSIAYGTNAPGRKAGETTLYDIFTVNVDDARASWLTASKTADSWYPRFSPDGSKLAYISARILTYPDGSTHQSTYQVTLQDMKDLTRPPVALTTGEAYKLGPESVLEWSPDGSQILFFGERLYVMNADGSGVRPIGGTDYGRISNLTWLPGGNFALANEELLINLLTGDPMKFSFPYPVWYTKWIFPTGGTALQPLPAPTCAAGWTNLYAGVTAIVTGGPGDPPNRVRAGAGSSYEVIYQIYPQTLVKVIDGPVCADGLVYWKVEHAQIPGGSGWTAEGDFAEYWLKPYRP